MLGNGLEDVEDPVDRRLVGHLVGNHQRVLKRAFKNFERAGETFDKC